MICCKCGKETDIAEARHCAICGKNYCPECAAQLCDCAEELTYYH